MQPKHTQSSANAKTGGRSVNTLHLTTMQFIHRGTTITKKKRGSVIQICFWFYFKKEVLHTLLTFFWKLQVYQAEKCPPIVPVFNCTRILAGSSVPPLFSSVLCSSRWDFSCGWPVSLLGGETDNIISLFLKGWCLLNMYDWFLAFYGYATLHLLAIDSSCSRATTRCPPSSDVFWYKAKLANAFHLHLF